MGTERAKKSKNNFKTKIVEVRYKVMHIVKNEQNKVFDTIQNACLDNGLEELLNSGFMNEYQHLLQDIAKESQYKYNEKLLPGDFERIQASVNNVLENAATLLGSKEMSNEKRLAFDGMKNMVMLSDYMFAMASKELGCPDIPENFGSDGIKSIATNARNANGLAREPLYQSISDDERYNLQRKKDAVVVRGETQELINLCNSGKEATIFDALKLVSEYHALSRRQAGHNGIWRFFHSKENEERTKLLNDMKNAIDNSPLRGTIIEGRSIAEIANTAERRNITKMVQDDSKNGVFSEGKIMDRYNIHWTLISYGDPDTTRADAELARDNGNNQKEEIKNEEVNEIDNESEIDSEIDDEAIDIEFMRKHIIINTSQIEEETKEEAINSLKNEMPNKVSEQFEKENKVEDVPLVKEGAEKESIMLNLDDENKNVAVAPPIKEDLNKGGKDLNV